MEKPQSLSQISDKKDKNVFFLGCNNIYTHFFINITYMYHNIRIYLKKCQRNEFLKFKGVCFKMILNKYLAVFIGDLKQKMKKKD